MCFGLEGDGGSWLMPGRGKKPDSALRQSRVMTSPTKHASDSKPAA